MGKKVKAKITPGDIKLNIDGMEYPNTSKGFADAFKKISDTVELNSTSKSGALHGKESLIVSGKKKEVPPDVKTDTADVK